MTSHASSVSSLLIRALITLAASLISQSHAKFLKADLRWPGFRKAYNDPQPSLTDILAFREPYQDPVFEKAMRVVDTLTQQSTCHQTAAAQLLLTCKALGAEMDKDDGERELLERAKSVYAVRVAVCETGEGRAAVPSACSSILDVPQRLDHEIDVVSSKTLAPCLGALMVEHYYWTSYSNNRQDANTLCQATTLESTRLEALHSYQKLAELLPEFHATLGSTRSQWLSFLKQQQEEVLHVSQLQRKNREELQAQHKTEVGAFRDAMQVAKKGLLDVSQDLKRAMANAGSDVTQTREALKHVLADFTNLQVLLQEAGAAANEKNAEVAATQARNMASVHDLAVSATNALKNMNADALVQDVNLLVHQLKADLNQISIAHSLQLESTQHQLKLSEELSAAQETNLALGEQMKQSSSSIASELETASTAAERVTTKLDKVNQALTRVEAASAVLSSVFAAITMPCQLVEHLHLKLLGVFAMPAIALSFWKPRKYSYSLIALYVFLESLISLLEEHRENISISLSRLVNHSLAISNRASTLFTGRANLSTFSAKVLFISVLVLAILVRYGHLLRLQQRHLTTTTSRSLKNPSKATRRISSLTLNPTGNFDDSSTLAQRYSLQQRQYQHHSLRHSGKHSPPVLDRWQRAATVC